MTRMAGRCSHPDCPDGIYDTDIPCDVCGIGKPQGTGSRAANPIIGVRIQPERRCSRAVDPKDVDVVCGKVAVIHILWNEEPDGWEQGFACAAHAAETAKWNPAYTHPVGADCGMPGSLFYAAENVCRTPPDGFPVIEAVAREAVHA